MDISEYTLVYEITSLPHIIFAATTPANEPFDLKEITIGRELFSTVIECRFSLYNSQGALVDLVSKVTSGAGVKSIANIIPLKMIENLVKTKSNIEV